MARHRRGPDNDKASTEAAKALSVLLKHYRTARGWSQVEAASHIGHATERSWNRWEQGLALPDGLNLLRVSLALGVSPFALLGLEDPRA
jgi:transcriptional regulator with XRE-family HTH domain